MHLIDTNVVSELIRPEPMSAVVAWFARHNAQEMYLAAVSEAELRYGLAIMPVGRRRNALETAIVRWLDQGFVGRILPFDSAAARAYAEIGAFRRRVGRPISEAIARSPRFPEHATPFSSRAMCGTLRERALRSSIPGRQVDQHNHD